MKPAFVSSMVTAAVLTSACTPKNYTYESSAELSGIMVDVGLRQSHPFLAEYKRYIVLEDKAPIYLGLDSGGESHVNVFDTGAQLTLQTDWTHVLLIDKTTQAYVLEARPLTEAELNAFVGKFVLDDSKNYVFIHSDSDSTFDPKVVKGG